MSLGTSTVPSALSSVKYIAFAVVGGFPHKQGTVVGKGQFPGQNVEGGRCARGFLMVIFFTFMFWTAVLSSSDCSVAGITEKRNCASWCSKLMLGIHG